MTGSELPAHNRDSEVDCGTICPLCGQDTAITDEGTWEVCSHLLLDVDVTYPYACGTYCPCEPTGFGTIPTEALVALNEAVRAFFDASASHPETVARWIVSFPPNLAVLVGEIEQHVSRRDGGVVRDDDADLSAFADLYHRVLGQCTGYYGWTSWVQDIPFAPSEYWLFWATDGAKCTADFVAKIEAFTILLRDAATEMK
jgi:hypothetical protein